MAFWADSADEESAGERRRLLALEGLNAWSPRGTSASMAETVERISSGVAGLEVGHGNRQEMGLPH